MRILLAEDELPLARALLKIFEKIITLPMRYIMEKTPCRISNRETMMWQFWIL